MTTTTSDETATKEEVIERVRPLNATQTRNLTKLVMEDFESLRMELKQFNEDRKNSREKEMRAGADYRVKSQYIAKGQALVDEYMEKVRVLNLEAMNHGINVSCPSVHTYNVTAKETELDRRVTIMKQEFDREYSQMLTQLNRKEIEAKRRILRASITSDAELILDSIPSAEEFMIQAAQEREAKQLQ